MLIRWLKRIGYMLVGAGTLLTFASAAGGQTTRNSQVGKVVYYHVTYADGSVEELTVLPSTNDQIASVLRVSESGAAGPRARVLSTGPVPVSQLNRTWTVKTDLRWNGRSWTGPEVATSLRPQATEAVGSDRIVLRRLLQGELDKHIRKVSRLAGNLAEAERFLSAAASPAQIELARKQSDTAKAAYQKALLQRSQFESILELLDKPDSGLAKPRGKILTPDEERFIEGNYFGTGVAGSQGRIVPHRTQVWPLPVAAGPRQYTVSLAHPEAGSFGAFYYVAYADTNNDGKPDELIGRSPLAVADEAGGWSSWSFTAEHPRVFVGNAWIDQDTSVFFEANLPTSLLMDELGGDAWIADVFGGPLRRHGYGYPYFTNLRVYVDNQNPD